MKKMRIFLLCGLLSLIFAGENAYAKNVIVQKNDSFWKIAKNNNVSFAKLIALNREKLVFPGNPDLIYPDQVFELPEESEAVVIFSSVSNASNASSKTQVDSSTKPNNEKVENKVANQRGDSHTEANVVNNLAEGAVNKTGNSTHLSDFTNIKSDEITKNPPFISKKEARKRSSQEILYPDRPTRFSAILGPILVLSSPILFFSWLAFFGKRQIGPRFISFMATFLSGGNKKKGFVCYYAKDGMFSFVSFDENYCYKAGTVGEIAKFIQSLYSRDVCSFHIPKKFLTKYLPLSRRQRYEFNHGF